MNLLNIKGPRRRKAVRPHSHRATIAALVLVTLVFLLISRL